MKKTIFIIPIFLLLNLLAIIGCQATKAKESQKQDSPPTLNSSMQDLKNTISILLPYAVDPQQFNSEKNSTEIEKQIKHINELSKVVVHNPAIQKQDPSLRFISSAFRQDVERIEESYRLGQKEYARYSIMNLTSYCIECHTRTSSGPSFNSDKLNNSLSSLNPIQKIEFLVASRQFDLALSSLESHIKNRLAGSETGFNDLEKSVRYALAVTIKFQDSPSKAEHFINLIEQTKNTPFYLQQSAKSWKLAIKSWKSEKKSKFKNPSDYLKKARELMNRARQTQTGSIDRSGDIYYLRALSILHKVLMLNLSKDQLGESLLLTGTAYEAVRDLEVWSLHDNYFESCIRQVPHTSWSQSCYKKLEESYYFGFSGSSGLRIPIDIQMKLDQLKKLAFSELQK
jgi:hypothetical protein